MKDSDYLARQEPPNSCPDIDSIIRDCEEVRTINKALRNWADSLLEALRNKEDEIEELQNELYKLEIKL